MSTAVDQYQKQITRFRAMDESNYIFACQAAVPLILTPDLLYQLWNNFRQYHYEFDTTNTPYKISHIAVSDLLLSGLCREVGHEIYEIEKGIRDILLTDLVANLGEKRKNTIAAFLADYAKLEYKYTHRKNLKDIHLLTAQSILNPAQMEQQIVERLNAASTDAEKINYLMLHHNLLPLGYVSDLREISKAVTEIHNKSLSPVLIAEEDASLPGVLKVTLPSFYKGKVYKKKKSALPLTTIDESDALRLIRTCLETSNQLLDLGNCGLRDEDFKAGSEIDKALRACTHLTTLNLSNNWIDYDPETEVMLYKSINSGEDNFLNTIPLAVAVLVELQKFICGGEDFRIKNGEGDNYEWWGIEDISALRQLEKLNYLDLRSNEIQNLTSIKRLRELRYLKLNNNNFSSRLDQLDGRTKLKFLHLSGCGIVSINDLEKIKSLRTLDLSNNSLSKINELRKFGSIEELDLSYNSSLNIGGVNSLRSLKKLSLINNNLTDVGALKNLPSLATLDISKNSISDISPLIPFIARGGILIANDNPLSIPPMEIVALGNEAILNFFKEKQNTLLSSERPETANEPQSLWTKIRVTETIAERIVTLHFEADIRTEIIFSSITFGTEILNAIVQVNSLNPNIGRSLYNDLIPAEISHILTGKADIIWLLDKNTIRYPWELLVDRNRRPLVTQLKMIRQIDNRTIAVIPVSYLSKNVLIIGDPDLNGFMPQLANTANESLLLSKLMVENSYKTTPLINSNASTIINELFSQNYKIIHIAGHGVAAEKSSENGGVLIGNNLFLTTREFIQLAVLPELIFINCSHIGKTDMAHTLIEYGVKAVIVAGGELDDNAAAHFAEIFYISMLAGNYFSDALQSARQAIFERYPKSNTWGLYQGYGDPYYRFESVINSKIELAHADLNDPSLNVEWNAEFSSRKQPVVLVKYFGGNGRGTGFLLKGSMLHKSLGDELVLLTTTSVAEEYIKSELEEEKYNKDYSNDYAPPSQLIVTFEALDNGVTEFATAGVIWSSPVDEYDTTILKFGKYTIEELQKLTEEMKFYPIEESADATDSVYIIGHPFGDKQEVSLSNDAHLKYKYPYINYNVPTDPGSAGSPVFNEALELIGMHHAKNAEGMGQGIWIGAIVSELGKYFEKQNTKHTTFNIFLTSSVELKADREAIQDFALAQKVHLNERDLHCEVQLIKWRDDKHFFPPNEYRQEFIDSLWDCDLLIMLIGSTVSEYAKLTCELALDFNAQHYKPRLLFYFDAVKMDQPVEDMILQIKNAGHEPIFYERKNSLLGHFSDKLTQYTRAAATNIPIEITNLAREYEGIRASMPAGDERTRMMQNITMDLHALSESIVPLLPVLVLSSSPGERLAAIVALQKSPDISYLHWLSGSVGDAESHFIGLQACRAIRQAAKSYIGFFTTEIQSALKEAREKIGKSKHKDPNQIKVLNEVEKMLDNT